MNPANHPPKDGLHTRGDRAKTVAVFGFDAAESSQIRRMTGLLDAGYDVIGFMMRRRNMNADFVPFWNNVHLYTVENENLLKRAIVLIASIFKIARHVTMIRRADVLLARNFDLLLLAHAARLLARKPVPIVYECLDVHAAFTDRSLKGAAFRWMERRLLARSALLVVSSPGFLTHYFGPVQHYGGPAHLMENKIWFSGKWPERQLSAPSLHTDRRDCGDPDDKPLVLGWVGSQRSEPSLEILTGAARRLTDGGAARRCGKAARSAKPSVELALFGNVHRHVLPDFEERLSEIGSAVYYGPYVYPGGLSVYRGLDLVWAQDLWQRGANSDWLLPNRIYEASYFGCLSIAVAGTETAKIVAERGLGYILPEASSEALADFLMDLNRTELAARRQALLARPATDFVSTPQDVVQMVDGAFKTSRHTRVRPSALPAGPPYVRSR